MAPLVHYQIHMPVRLSDNRLATYVAAAEDGYLVVAPGQEGIQPTQVVAVRLTAWS